MGKIVAIALFAATTTVIGENKADVHYAGLGRYTCDGNSAKCAQINANNRALEGRNRQRWERDYEQGQRENA